MGLGEISGQVRLDIRQAVAAYAALRAQNQRTVYAMRGTGDAFVSSGRVMTGAGLGMVAMFGLAVSKAAEFERKMDFFAAVSNTSAAGMERLSEVTLQLAQDTIYTAGEMADGFIELGKAGVSAEDIINGIGQAMANLGAAGDIPLAKSGQIITSTIQQFDMKAQDAVRVVDLLAGAANASIADIEDIGVSLKYVGGVAAVSGLSVEDTTTAISLLAKAGIRGSTAGTSLRQMLVSLSGATLPATKVLTDLGIITEDGSNKFYDMNGNLKPLSKVFQILQNSMKGYNSEQKLSALRTIFNNRALSAAAILTRGGAKGFEDMYAEMSKTSAADVAAERLDNLSGDIEILQGNIETMLTKAGGPFQETLRGWVQGITRLVQAFANLDPGTQKMIMQTLAIGGVLLIAMGIFALFVGYVMRVGIALIRLAQALKFVWTLIRTLLWIFGLITGGVITGTFLAIAAAVIAVGAAFVLAYKYCKPFRDFVNHFASEFMKGLKQIGNGIMAVLGWFKKLGTDPKAAWDDLKNAAGDAAGAIKSAFSRLGGMIGDALGKLGDAASRVVDQVVNFFLELPGRILSAIVSLVPTIITFFAQLPYRIGYLIGFMIGMAVKLFLSLQARLWGLASSIVSGVIRFFASLPGKIGYLIGFLVGRAIRLWLNMNARILSLAARLVVGVINFIKSLPGRVASIISTMATRAINLFNRVKTEAPRIINAMIRAIIGFFSRLPGQVANFLQMVNNRARTALSKLPGMAVRFGKGIFNGIRDAINGLPGLVTGIVGRMITAFRGQITAAFNAVRDFGKGLWNGFKDGIGMNSPSYFEKAMWQITDTIDEETKKLAKQTLNVQRMSRTMAATEFGVGTIGVPDVKALAATRVMGTQILEGSIRSNSAVSVTIPTPTESKILSGELSIDESGRAFFSGVASDVYDDNSDYDDVLRRMN